MPGCVFWTASRRLLASALPVRLPQGTVVSVAAAPMIAALVLGRSSRRGDRRGSSAPPTRAKSRGEVPWYGTLFNHAAVVYLRSCSAELSSRSSYGCVPRRPVLSAQLVHFVAALVAARRLLRRQLRAWRSQPSARRTGSAFPDRLGQDIGGVAANLIGLGAARVADGADLPAAERCGLVGDAALRCSALHNAARVCTATSRRGSCSSRRSAPCRRRWTRATRTRATTRTG